MADEQQSEPSNPEPESQPASTEDPTITQSLIFSRYVVAEVYSRIERKLGVKGIRSDEDIAWMVQRGLRPAAIEVLSRHGMSEGEIHRLIISRRALAAHREKREPLTCEEPDRVTAKNLNISPQSGHTLTECAHLVEISGHSMVLVITIDDLPEPGTDFA